MNLDLFNLSTIVHPHTEEGDTDTEDENGFKDTIEVRRTMPT